ncbi:MFS transporter [Ideonella sp. B7]|uniref:MFS transporter n=1 Tax=Ideonella benzenivorans TaxID=2831643 RepID=UPI001CEDB3E8|nr:MFS transporter [Ideonella benzenivorans]MCA6217820.1 MFS transporter [Ideonella benzenivorans]
MSPEPSLALAEGAAGPRLRDQADYLHLLTARIAGTSANQMLMVALGWQMYDLTRSAWQLGLVGLVQFLPALLFTLPAGHLVDRHDRRRLLALSLSLQSGVAVILALASLGAAVSAGLILVLSVLLGMARAVQMPALQALTPTLVPPPLLARAVATNSSAMQAAVVLAPALGGVLYGSGPALGRALVRWPLAAEFWGAAAVYATSWLLLGVAILAVLGIRPRPMAARPPSPGWRELTAGIRYIRAQPVVLGAISLDLFAVLLGGATALLPIYARDILHSGPEALGLLRSAPALGAVVVGVWLARRPLQHRAGVWLLGSVAVFGLATIAFGFSRSLWPAFLALAVTGAADMVSVVIRQTLVQLETPDAMRGRVSAVNSVFIGASNQLGEFESGAVAAWLGPVPAVVLGGVGTLLVVALWWRGFPALARRDRLTPA